MQPITDSDLEMFKERSRTELRSNCDVLRLAWDDVVPALCNEVVSLRKQLAAKEEALKDCKVFLGETIQCGVEGEMLDGRHVNVAASDLADKIDDVLKGDGEAKGGDEAVMRKALADTAANLRIHLQIPAPTISMNRLEVEAMASDCEKALGEDGYGEALASNCAKEGDSL